MIKCSECGYENMDGLDYCDGCGAKLAAAEGAPAASLAVRIADDDAARSTIVAAPAIEEVVVPVSEPAVIVVAPVEPAVAPSSEAKTGEITPLPGPAPAVAAAV